MAMDVVEVARGGWDERKQRWWMGPQGTAKHHCTITWTPGAGSWHVS